MITASTSAYKPPRLTSVTTRSGTSLIHVAISTRKPLYMDCSTSAREKS